MKSNDEATLQQDAAQYVQKHVVACVSTLIFDNAEAWIHDSDYSEEAHEILKITQARLRRKAGS